MPAIKEAKAKDKDLISLRNSKNGEIYKFSCKVCMDGHRAPLCDPKKHRGKIMFRRPAPGRPSRQCGHPKSKKCDCLAKRTLCCVLNEQEWDAVEQGEIVCVNMYESEADLELAQKLFEQASISQSSATIPGYSMPFAPLNNIFPMYTQPQPQSHHHRQSVPGLFSISNGTAQPVQPIRHLSYAAAEPSSYDLFASDASPVPEQAHSGQDLQPASANLSNFNYAWPQSQLAGNSANTDARQSHFASAGEDVFLRSLQENRGMAPVSPMTSTMDNLYKPHYLDPNGQYSAPGYPALPIRRQQMDHDGMQQNNSNVLVDFTVNRREVHLSSLSMHALSPHVLDPVFSPHSGSYAAANAEPSAQFPCASCASMECDCLTCPVTMQNLGSDGRWEQACGREGHGQPGDDLMIFDESNSDVAAQPTKPCCAHRIQQQHPSTMRGWPASFDHDLHTVDPSHLSGVQEAAWSG